MKKRKSPSLAPSGGKEGGRNSPALKDGRVRPTNNQLLYKTHLRWDKHYTYGTNPALNLPSETPGFPSVTSAFLRVLSALQKAEEDRCGRSILQLLSTNTRRTKVVELSSGTHRVPDELKKHYLSDATGGQYSTNLDRNRYGQDDNYLFTVIRYDLEFLGLCPCLVDVEIVDVKAGNQSIIVSAGDHYCKCKQNTSGQCEGNANGQLTPAASQSRRGGRHHGPAPPQLTTVPGTGNSSSQPQIMRMDSSGKLSDLAAAVHLPQRSPQLAPEAAQLPPGHGQPPHPQQLPTGPHFPWDPSGFAAAVGVAPTLPFPGFTGPLTLPPSALNPNSSVGAGGAPSALHPAGSLAGLHNSLSASTSLPSLPSLTLPPHASSSLPPLGINATTAAGAVSTQNPLHQPPQHGLPEHTLGLSIPPQLHPGGLIPPAHPNLIGASFPPNNPAGLGGAGNSGSNPMLSSGVAGGMNAFSPLVAQGGILGGQGPPPSPGSAADVAAAAAVATTHSLQRSPMHRAEQNLPPSPPAINQQASSPQPSVSGASQLFDTLVMAATGGCHDGRREELLGSAKLLELFPHKFLLGETHLRDWLSAEL
ncbi:hypothetical protein DUNSADRAFT_8994 [Dunaliella salina]|uniref:Uncharacterized protein n=1 Tax=Dunaliella salina TaxID=3046 RepID=A0ABQ7GIF7_DUNSA|nr:hypothetical protein DUNSADRAFT_8994 [Dunaliella salina]|eukprot:KAF5834371.1 hypothetical protein DUNSADRAFT_8994 [Dunaliella salina]